LIGALLLGDGLALLLFGVFLSPFVSVELGRLSFLKVSWLAIDLAVAEGRLIQP